MLTPSYKPSTFVSNVIKRAVNHINENTECRVEYLPIKTGKEFTDVRFFVESSWRTLEEKLEYLEWEDKNPKLRDAARDDRKRLLKSGEGEVYLDGKNSFRARGNASD